MNIVDSTDESSCKAQENGDASNGSERPLKKARFAWQVKGKHHLKNDSSDVGKMPSVEAANPERAGSSGSSNSNTGREQNLEILGDYLLDQEFIPLKSVITEPEKSLLIPSTSISTEKLQFPRYVSSYENNTSNNVLKRTNGGECSVRNIRQDTLPSMSVSQNYLEDQCIARWQSRQMAKGFVDNTINRVLDSWIQVQLPPEDDGSRFLALDVADFINNLPGANTVENEGILMAISAHGLQNTSNSSTSNTEEDIPTAVHSPSPQRSLSPIPSDEESHEPSNNPCDTDTDTSSNNLDMTWSYSEEQKNDINDLSCPLFPDPSSLSYDYLNENHHNSNNECAQDNHCDFLDAAVLFAIQSKGLTTFGTDYG